MVQQHIFGGALYKCSGSPCCPRSRGWASLPWRNEGSLCSKLLRISFSINLPLSAISNFFLHILNVDRKSVFVARMLMKYLSSISYRVAQQTKAIIMQGSDQDLANGTVLIQANINLCYSTVTCKVLHWTCSMLLNQPHSKLGQSCANSIIYVKDGLSELDSVK